MNRCYSIRAMMKPEQRSECRWTFACSYCIWSMVCAWWVCIFLPPQAWELGVDHNNSPFAGRPRHLVGRLPFENGPAWKMQTGRW